MDRALAHPGKLQVVLHGSIQLAIEVAGGSGKLIVVDHGVDSLLRGTKNNKENMPARPGSGKIGRGRSPIPPR
jgi:hypothetical protein